MDMDAAVDDVLQLNVDVVAVRLPVGDIEPVLIRRVVDDLDLEELALEIRVA